MRSIGLIDDNDSCKQAIEGVLTASSFQVISYASAVECLQSETLDTLQCLIVDYVMPGMNGIEFIRELRIRGYLLPIVAISGYSTIPLAVDFMRLGAVQFLEKPLDFQVLLATLGEISVNSTFDIPSVPGVSETTGRLNGLTQREKEILGLGLAGLGIKQISAKLVISRKTVEVHRSNILRKVGESSMQELMLSMITRAPELSQILIKQALKIIEK